jgi:hypothetical protein
MKPGKTFKLSKTTKRMIGLMKGATAEQRNQYKRMMIDAQLCGAVVVKREPRENKGGRGTGYTNTATSATPSA